MNPNIGFELNVSSSVRGGHWKVRPNSLDFKKIVFSDGSSFKFSPLMKMLVPPLNEAHEMPEGVSELNNVPFLIWSCCSLYPMPSSRLSWAKTEGRETKKFRVKKRRATRKFEWHFLDEFDLASLEKIYLSGGSMLDCMQMNLKIINKLTDCSIYIII